MDDPRRFIFNSDFPIDHVVYIREVDVPFSSSGVEIGHNLGFTPLLMGLFSADNWASSMPIDTPASSGDNVGNVQVESNRYSIKLINYGRLNRPIKVRLFGLMPSDVNVDVSPPQVRYSRFNFNTDFNYSKLVKAGVFNTHWNSGENIVYHHGLGYILEVEVWQEDNSGVVKKLFNVYDPNGVNFSSMGSRIVYAKITTQDFIIRTDGANQDITKIHYRIYGDQNG
jgi:hypothetical protein|nr:MAG TPA: hypothetical protein [Caudoviricetes sp.]